MPVDTRVYTAEELLALRLPYELVDGKLWPQPLPEGVDYAAITDEITQTIAAHLKRHSFGVHVNAAGGIQTGDGVVFLAISPADTYTAVTEKLHRYRTAGTRAIVIVERHRNLIEVHRADGVTKIADTLTLEELPGWSLSLDDLFTAVR